MYVVISNNGISMYNLNCIVCFKCFLIVGVYCISYRCFQRQKCIKLIVVIVSVRLKRKKLVLCENSVSLISLRSRYVLYWDGELILSLIWMWPAPQLYRCCSFGCRYIRGGGWSSGVVSGVLRLKLTATVVMCWTMGFLFCIFCIWLVTCVSLILLCSHFFGIWCKCY